MVRMKNVLLLFGLATLGLLTGLPAQTPKTLLSWAPKPIEASKWVSPNRPHVVYAELLAKHKGQQNWVEPVQDDEHLHGEFISSAPGTKTPKRFHPDTREWWVITEGQIRFHIDGQEPFVASKGWLVQVPYRTVYSMETIGDTPSIRLETNIAHARTLYPMDMKPPKLDGFEFVPVRIAGPVSPDNKTNRFHATFEELAAEVEATPKKQATLRFVHDDRAAVNFIYGYAKDLPPVTDGDRGHYHVEGGEFWIVLSGQIRYKIEGIDTFIAQLYDCVYVPKFKFHLARWYGDGASTRLAMNGYYDIAHLFDAPPPGPGK
jgi:mannose-6-phosphate isomerase-like protein (cupin superfamily)